jgi:hypothetical protein
MLARGMASLQAVKLLVQNGFGGDATSVMRTLIELDIDLAYILSKDTDERLKQFFEYGHVDTYRLLQRVAGQISPQRLEAARKLFEAVEGGYRTKKNRHINSWTRVTVRDRAIAVDRKSNYDRAYALGCGASHSGMATLKYAIDSTEDGTVTLHTGARETTATALEFASMALARLAASVSAYFKFDIDQTLEAIESRLLAATEQLSKAE